mmetsp:Transcript_10047/g.13675  ORF Transcript_10047/g.13675 Transcript_10047/m.13675 type:complete len:522 (-) Transcript_10047:148-1713(-)|eukprot:CAMPEP_0196572490 /NCGR_PEP_ID=MMETSP1081-20130531/2537_1 /TAXON_ID=36882 /ORGANISM="Pyramimonas amylifera, Strain CCMP720" /LENGTH=521 /DNA_ID=CAMNT_0041889839 /DNA_START=125 /DNA_END=1690 /DNA_ORIENTATION=+
MSSGKVYTLEDVAKHSVDGDCWIVIDHHVLDVSKFAKFHPGGKWALLQAGGKDVTEEFYALHRADVLEKYVERLSIGTLAGAKKIERQEGAISKVPYAEASFWQKGFKSVYYNDSHRELRSFMRRFVEKEMPPKVVEAIEDSGEYPSLEMYKAMGKAGIHSARIGPGAHMSLPDGAPPNGIHPDKFDYFHELIVQEEIARIGCPGFCDGIGAGLVIGLPPVIRFAQNAELARRVGSEVLRGDKRICLAITDPGAGSDVANINATAVKSACGKFFVVNGVKKWITNGAFCDYFTVAVRTGGPGMGGISMLLIERGPGVETKQIKTSYSTAAGTSYVFFEDVQVPVENLLGKENEGFKCIMDNFNHERWMIVCGVNRASRLIVEECLKWANQRMVFGKNLMAQPVIRNKLAHMTAQVEAVHNWLENLTYQMCKMSHAEQVKFLAGPIALLKLQSTRVSGFVLDEACQIFGGRAITRTGMGQVIERYQRSQKFGSILGGSEEIMADLGMKQAMKNFPKMAEARL